MYRRGSGRTRTTTARRPSHPPTNRPPAANVRRKRAVASPLCMCMCMCMCMHMCPAARARAAVTAPWSSATHTLFAHPTGVQRCTMGSPTSHSLSRSSFMNISIALHGLIGDDELHEARHRVFAEQRALKSSILAVTVPKAKPLNPFTPLRTKRSE
eukprot:3709071-Prymnesium_polylepis.1